MINTQYSRQIYRLLINGKTINRQIYDKLSGNLQDNGLFDEIAKHYNDTDGYRVLYSNIGYELVLQPHYAYLRDRDASADELSDTAIAIQAILTVLAQTVIQSGYRYGLLVSEHAGVSQELCARADQSEEMCKILEECKCNPAKTLWENAENVLVRRDIAYINAKGNLVLSNSGQDFFNTVFEQSESEALREEWE